MRLFNHRPALAFFSILLGLTSVRAAEVSFVRVWPGYRSAQSFERISEYFTGKENTGSQIVLRSRPAERAGFYFLVRTKNAGAPATGATFQLHVLTPASATPRIFTFRTDLPAGQQVYDLGLTGTDWPDDRTHPVAWKLVLLAPDGAELAQAQSYLWEKPPGQD